MSYNSHLYLIPRGGCLKIGIFSLSPAGKDATQRERCIAARTSSKGSGRRRLMEDPGRNLSCRCTCAEKGFPLCLEKMSLRVAKGRGDSPNEMTPRRRGVILKAEVALAEVDRLATTFMFRGLCGSDLVSPKSAMGNYG